MIEYKGVLNKQILIKVASRGRKDTLITIVSEVVRLAKHPEKLYWMFSFDEYDESYSEKMIAETLTKAFYWHVIFGTSTSKIHAINRDIDSAPPDWNILVNLSDDQLCVAQDWDVTIRNAMPPDTDASLWYHDGRQSQINTMEIVGRKYYDRFGYIYNPEYKSFFCDQESTDVGLRLGKLIKSPEMLFKHCHPKWTKETLLTHDETYRAAELHWDHDQAVYNRRRGK